MKFRDAALSLSRWRRPPLVGWSTYMLGVNLVRGCGHPSAKPVAAVTRQS